MKGNIWFRVVVLVPILWVLLFFAYVAQQRDFNTIQEVFGLRRSFSRLWSKAKVKRADKSHVILLTEFSYIRGGGVQDFDVITNITIGGNHNLILSVTPQHVTWVPQEPGSVVDFCNEERNPQNKMGCEVAGRSNYYKAIGNTRTDGFSFHEGYLDVSINETATGYWVEDTITADGIAVRLQFGVALQWHTSPILGLGLQPVNQNPRRPGYIDALKQQGKITGRFCSLYNHMTPNTTGEIVLGGVDATKFQGKLTVWNRMGIPGEIDAPSVRISNGTGRFKGPFENEGKSLAVIDPLARSLFIPRNMYSELITTLDAYGLQKNEFNNLALPCDRDYSSDDILEFRFNETVVKIEFNHLKGIEFNGSLGLCELLVFPTEMVLDISKPWSFVLGGPFFRAAYTVLDVDTNSTGIGILNPAPVGRDIIELGGSFGTSLDRIEGGLSPPQSANTESSRSLSSGGIAGVVIAAIFVLVTALGATCFLRRRRRKNIPDIPSPEGYPSELSPDVRPRSELEAKTVVPVSHELPVYSMAAYELEADMRR
ncbi:hypothetical protein TWF506_008132 [Arthrobotrys conoides]|uniref:Peptidase A1 domain-containing protein n=1 Tax=Arthrobotrys conoides TaxID=74498 RepID=A0AAN8RXY2_9PEZI